MPLLRIVWLFLKNLKIEIPFDPANLLPGVCLEETIIQKDTCTPMFTAALFTTARTQKKSKCPSTEEWVKKMWYLYTMEYYSAIKRNEVGSCVEMLMDLETVLQSKLEKQVSYINAYTWNLENCIHDLICKTEIDTQMQRKTYGHQEGKGGMNWEIGIDAYTSLILCIKQVTNENLLYSSGNSSQSSVVT